MLRKEDLIDQAMVIGFQRPYITALIIPNFDLLKRWCIDNDVHWTGPQYMVIHPKVVKLFQGIIDHINENLKRHEFIKNFDLLFEEWTVGTGEYTPTLKLKRRVILEKYKKEIEKMYG
jgi:long-chain acyl-CoA synthetase